MYKRKKYDKDDIKYNTILKYTYHNDYDFAVNIALSEIDYEKNNIIKVLLNLSEKTVLYEKICNLEFTFISQVLMSKSHIAVSYTHHSSASKMMKKLGELGLIKYERYGMIVLTEPVSYTHLIANEDPYR